jgi:hypothetical protein
MKKQLLFIALFITSFINAQSMEFTSAELTTAEVGSTVTVNYKYTSAVSAQIYCAINKYDAATWSATVGSGFLGTAAAGTDITGSFDLVIPPNTELTEDLTGSFNYKLVIQMKTEDGVTWLAGDYPTTEINLVASTSTDTNSITITSPIANVEVGSTITVNYKYTSTETDSYIYVGLNQYTDTTWKSFVNGADNGVVNGPGTDITGSISFEIPVGTVLTADLTSPDNYKLSVEMKEKVGWTIIASDYPTAETNIVAAGTLGVNNINLALEQVALYPNPAKNNMQISNYSNLINPSIKIFNVLGKEVVSTSLSSDKVDISYLVRGVYIMKLKSDNKFKNIKFIKN